MVILRNVIFGVLRLIEMLSRGSADPARDHLSVRATRDRAELEWKTKVLSFRVRIPCDGDLLPIRLSVKELLAFVSGADRTAPIELKLVDAKHLDAAYELVLTSFDCTPAATPLFDRAPERWNKEAEWPAAELRDAVAWVMRAASHDPTRPGLSGVFFDHDNVVATDGARLHLQRLLGPRSGSLLLPAYAATALVQLPEGEKIKLFRSGDVLRFRCDRTWELRANISTAQFPDL